MSIILTNFYERLRSSINVSDVVRNIVSLHKKGNEYSGLCPFHSEKTPSFTINDQKRFYHCFGCGAHGDLIKFESEQSGLSYKDAAYKLAEKFGIEKPKLTKEQEQEQQLTDRLLSLLSQASNFFVSQKNSKISDILNKRGILDESAKKYKIGYTGVRGELIEYFNKKSVRLEELVACGLLSKNNDGKYYEVFRDRIIIPIYSNFGKVIAFGGRSIGDEMPKYLNSPESIIFKKGECLYGEEIATGAAYKTGRIIIVEGYFDAISLHKIGYFETVASLGTAITTMHLQKMWKLVPEIIICLDGDEAGIRASKKVLDIALPHIGANNRLSFAVLPKGSDPDEVATNYGHTGVTKILDARMSFSEYIFYSLTFNKTFNNAEEQAELEQKLSDTCLQITDVILRKNIHQYFKKQCWGLFNNKNFKIKSAFILKNDTINTSSDLENLEDLIICFVVTNSTNFSKEIVERSLAEISEKNNQHKDLIECILDIISTEEVMQEIVLIEDLKKTSFYKQFEILSAKCKSSMPKAGDRINCEAILDFLLTKRHLILLTIEFTIITQTNDENTAERLNFYLSEIKNTKDKIDKFNMQVTNK